MHYIQLLALKDLHIGRVAERADESEIIDSKFPAAALAFALNGQPIDIQRGAIQDSTRGGRLETETQGLRVNAGQRADTQLDGAHAIKILPADFFLDNGDYFGGDTQFMHG